MLRRYIDTKNVLPVPFSGGLYNISLEGVITDIEGDAVPTTLNNDGDLVAWMYLWKGWDHYLVAKLLIHTFKPTKVPFKLWSKLNVLFIDGNHTNLHPSNLIWKFPVGLVCSKYPGYAYIPGYSRYVINKEGDIIEHISGKKKKYCIIGKGYRATSVLTDTGQRTAVGRHRLLALTWLTYSENVNTLDVNHINGIPGSDALENLEWATRKRNCDHAYSTGLRSDNRPVLTYDIVTGKETEHYSQAESGRYLGIDPPTALRWLDQPGQMIRSGHILMKYKSDTTPWRHVSSEELAEHKRSLVTAILVRNAKTGTITMYDSIRECSDSLKLDYHSLYHRLVKADQAIYSGYLQFQYLNQETEWRIPEDVEQEHLEAVSGLGVFSRDVVTGEIKTYVSALQCAKELGLSEMTIAVRLRNEGQPVYPGNLQFKRMSDITPWRDVVDVESELARYPRSVCVRNVFTNEEWLYETVVDAAKALHIKTHSILDRIQGDDSKPYFNYEFKYAGKEWPTYTEEHLKLFRLAIEENKPFRGRGFILEDIYTGEREIYTGRDTLSEFLGVASTYVNNLAKSGVVVRNQYRIRYMFV